MQCTDSFGKTLLITGPYIFVINKFTNAIPTCVISWPSNLHMRMYYIYAPCLVCLLQPPFNLGNHQILSNIFYEFHVTKLCTVLAGCIYFIIVQSLLHLLQLKRLTRQCICVYMLRMCSRKLNTFNNQILNWFITFLLHTHTHTHNVSSSSCANEHRARRSAQCVFLVMCYK